MKVTIVGAGNVGASCAEYIAQKKIASKVVLLDIKKGFAEGKALDLFQTATTLDFNTSISFLISCFKLSASFFPSIIIIKINLGRTFQKQNSLKTLTLKLILLEKCLLNLS